jgi:phosphoesterase, MJ0936 family
MRILLVSDSHMYNHYLERILIKYKETVDLFIHCGDSSLPLDHKIIKQFNIIVKGNHDEDHYPDFYIYKNIFITHGHLFNVYHGYDRLLDECKDNDCQICFHGHTHVPTFQTYHGVSFINPGSIMINRGSYGYGTYAIIDVDNDNILVHYYHHETDEIVDSIVLKEGLEVLEDFKHIAAKKNKIID